MNKSHHNKTRRRRSRDEWAEVVKEWTASGMEPEDYAEKHGLSETRMLSWAGTLGFPTRGKATGCKVLRAGRDVSSEFLPVGVMPAGSQRGCVLPETACIEVSTPNGGVVRIKGMSCSEALDAVLRTL